MNETVDFGTWLRQQREALDLTRERLAGELGCAGDTIRKIEMGRRRPSREVAELIARRFAVPPTELESFISFARGLSSTPPTAAAPVAVTPSARPGALLPQLPTPLIGREELLAQLIDLLIAPLPRLITLTGPPGIGKTSLSIALAAAVRDHFADGVYFVPLAPLSDPGLVATTIARTLHMTPAPDRPLVESLHDYLWQRNLLLVLDNFEQLLPAAPLVAELLSMAPKLKVLVTSRGVLRLRGEKEMPLTTLELPGAPGSATADEMAQSAAVRLFVARAGEARPDFALSADNATAVAAICRKLDGLPLAIELAAARIRVLAPPEMLQRLTRRLDLLADGPVDLPLRQRTLRNAIDWGYDLLAPPEQALFRRLSVFAGGCTLEAVEALTARRENEPEAARQPATGNRHALLNALDTLARMSMVRLVQADGPERFWMLETIREYGLEKLAASGEEDEIRQAHGAYFRDLAERAMPELGGTNQAFWLNRLQYDQDNLRAAMRWSLDSRQVGITLRMGTALWRFWWARGHMAEGRVWLDEAFRVEQEIYGAGPLDANGAIIGNRSPEHLATLAGALHSSALILLPLGEPLAARARQEQSLALRRLLGDIGAVASSLNSLGLIASDRGEYTAARQILAEAIELGRQANEKRLVSSALINLASVVQYQGEYSVALDLQEQALVYAQELGIKTNVAITLGNMANTLQQMGDYGQARARLEESLVMRREMGNKPGTAVTLNNLGNVLYCQGNVAAALEALHEALAIRRDLGGKLDIGVTLSEIALIKLDQGEYAAAQQLLHESLVLVWECMSKDRIAKDLVGLAGLAGALGQIERAALLLGGAAALRETEGIPIRPAERARYDRILTTARDGLPDDSWQRAWAAGRATPLDQLVQLALLKV